MDSQETQMTQPYVPQVITTPPPPAALPGGLCVPHEEDDDGYESEDLLGDDGNQSLRAFRRRYWNDSAFE